MKHSTGPMNAVEAAYVPVPGLPHTYVTTAGDVYSDMPSTRNRTGMHRLRPADNGRGYLRVVRLGRNYCVHNLVAAAFHGPKPVGLEVNHRDGDKGNNRPENLEYVSRAENMKHCHRIGLGRPPRGERHGQARLSEPDARALRAEYAALAVNGRLPHGESRRLQQAYGVSESLVTSIGKGRLWRHLQ